LPPPEPGRGIRVPGDMAGATADPSPPVSFDLTMPPADFDLSTPAFGLTPPVFDAAPPQADVAPLAAEAAPPGAPDAGPGTEAPPTRASLGFAAAPVAADYAAPRAELALDGEPEPARAADPSYIWDLAATDVFPAATDGAGAPADAPSADEG